MSRLARRNPRPAAPAVPAVTLLWIIAALAIGLGIGGLALGAVLAAWAIFGRDEG